MLTLDGVVVLYWPNGKLKRRCHFSKGKRHGLDVLYNSSGYLVDEGHYDQGKPIGVHRRYHDAVLIEEIEYFGSRCNVRSWDETGELKVEAIWIDSVTYQEKVWDRFQKQWTLKKGFWDGAKLVYL